MHIDILVKNDLNGIMHLICTRVAYKLGECVT